MAARRTCGWSCESARCRRLTSSSRSGCVDAIAPSRMHPSTSGSWPDRVSSQERARRVDVPRGELADRVGRGRGHALVVVPDELGEPAKIARVAQRARAPRRRTTRPRSTDRRAPARSGLAYLGDGRSVERGDERRAPRRARPAWPCGPPRAAAGRRAGPKSRSARSARSATSSSPSASTSDGDVLRSRRAARGRAGRRHGPARLPRRAPRGARSLAPASVDASAARAQSRRSVVVGSAGDDLAERHERFARDGRRRVAGGERERAHGVRLARARGGGDRVAAQQRVVDVGLEEAPREAAPRAARASRAPRS